MDFEGILRLTQAQLFKRLIVPGCTYREGAYVLVPGEAPVLLVAHLDTVHHEPVQTVCYDKNRNVLMSPQGIGGDDRCGVYALREVYRHAKKKPWLLFTCDEEIGCVGAMRFCKDHANGVLPKGLKRVKFIVEIDRQGKDDAVYYDCDNPQFEKYITSKGFVTKYGSCSDISDVAPELGVAAVNLSSGYHNPHTLHEYIVMSELRATIRKVISIVDEAGGLPKYEYIKAVTQKGLYDYYNKYFGSHYFSTEEKKNMLMDLGYTKKELDNIEKEEGAWAISQMYVDEFGYYTDDLNNDDFDWAYDGYKWNKG